jgi:hypothetical protein
VGGEKDGRVMRIPGAISLSPGEELVFFGKRFRGYLVSYGVGLGKYLVHREAGIATVSPSYGEVAFVERRGETLVPAAPPAVAPTLEALTVEVRRALGGAK